MAITRRAVLAGCTGLGVAAGAAPALAAEGRIDLWPRAGEPRQVWLKRRTTGESVVARFHDGQRLVPEQYLACCAMLRDVASGEIVNIDLDLLNLVFVMQRWLVEWGIDRPLLVHSGYRSARTNSREGGARNSLHMEGRALDFSIPGIPSDYLGRLARVVSAGGVGFYVDAGFTHIDTGRNRTWAQRP